MGASKATVNQDVLASGKMLRNQWRQKTDDDDAEEEEAAAAENDAVATLGANVKDLKEAWGAAAATFPAQARACHAFPADDKENVSGEGNRGGLGGRGAKTAASWREHV